jgi:hypothetical protein
MNLSITPTVAYPCTCTATITGSATTTITITICRFDGSVLGQASVGAAWISPRMYP